MLATTTQHIGPTGVGGGSGSGKSTILRAGIRALLLLAVYTQRHELVLILLDWFYNCLAKIPTMEERKKTNFDEPEALDRKEISRVFGRLFQDGEDVWAPEYDFPSKTRKQAVHHLCGSAKLGFVDGIFVFAIAEVFEHLGASVFIDAPEDVRLERRIARDLDRSQETEEGTREMWQRIVQPGYVEYIEPFRGHATLVIENDNGQLEDAVLLFVRFMLERLSLSRPASEIIAAVRKAIKDTSSQNY